MPNLTLPGYNYLGPGNPLDSGTPVNKTDQIAEKHDWAYHYAKSDSDIFKADHQAIQEFGNESGLGAFLGKYGLEAKNLIEEKLIGKSIYPSFSGKKKCHLRKIDLISHGNIIQTI